ncbi:unnamed protein product [Timema podura]|uniref:Uncharacterized protein n=1 Tax=Timema podura TaxID=61482 RepID=A0ABN7NCD6_TIMPD|nr:unnamed protein product [Timema podura]
MYLHLRVEIVSDHLGSNTFNTLERDSNPDLPVTGIQSNTKVTLKKMRPPIRNVCLLIFVSAYPTYSKPVISEFSNVTSSSEDVQTTPMTEKNEPRDVKNAALANMALIGDNLQEDTDDAAMASSVNGGEVLARFVKEDPEEDMEVAEAVVFRPLFRYRQRQRKYGNVRRRYYSYYG